MNSQAELIAFFIGGFLLLLVVLGLLFAVILPGMDRWNKRFFIVLFSILFLSVSAFVADIIVYNEPELALAEKIISCLEFFFISIQIPLFTVFLLHVCRENWRRSALLFTALALWIVYFILLGIAQFTTYIYYVTPDNQYIRGPWFPLMLAPLIVIMFLNLIGVIRRRKSMSKKYFAAFLTYLLPLTAAIILQIFYYAYLIFDFAFAISALAMFGIILSDQIDLFMKQQQEITHQEARVMVLQMRPHFIYNAMMSIYYLCELDPKKAQQVTKDFTIYLRKNFTAIASEDTIPFSDELEHTRAYLAIEQAQFEDSLLVDYDTPHIRFRVPPLTLQPIVENAVKHGMGTESEPLHISIRTCETDSGNEIIVEDDGTGFDPADDSNPHIALTNIQQRLRLMCKGTMTIRPRDGGGTIVKITIP